MKNIERMLSNCGITYEVLPENDSLNKLAKSLRKKIIFDMLKDERTLFFYVAVLLVTMALSFIKGYPVPALFVTILFVIIIVPVQLILSFKYIKDVTNLYKSRTYYKLLTNERNATELTKVISDNVSRTLYKANGESYVKNRLYKRYLAHNSEIILIAFGDCDDLSRLPMMIANVERTHLPKSQIQIRLTNRDTGEVFLTSVKYKQSDNDATCCYTLNECLKAGNYLIEFF